MVKVGEKYRVKINNTSDIRPGTSTILEIYKSGSIAYSYTSDNKEEVSTIYLANNEVHFFSMYEKDNKIIKLSLLLDRIRAWI